MTQERINWFWAHRRNASLHHTSFLMRGLAGRGWAPAVNFWFDHQIIIGVPGKGAYFFYDRDQLSSVDKYHDVQESIDTNPNFVADFHRRTDEIFGAIFFKALAVEEANLTLLSQDEIAKLYESFLGTFTVAPFITVQLWGIEACFDEDWRIMRFLRDRLMEIGQSREFQYYKETLSVNTGETVAFTEQKDFYRVAEALMKSEAGKLFATETSSVISERLREYPEENAWFEQHTREYEWMNKEYMSSGWSREKWIEVFRDALVSDVKPDQKLQELLDGFRKLNEERQNVLRKLDPPADVMHALDSLAELIAQRDWAKGYMTKALLSYHKLLGEIARRVGIGLEDVFLYSYREVADLVLGKKLPSEEIEERAKNGYAIVVKGEEFSIVSGKENVRMVVENEGISDPFEKLANMDSFKGLGASRGVIRGLARVLEDASRLSELQAGEILVTYMTTIEFTPAFRRAGAVITDEGGMSCHAAIVSREFRIPCVVGTKVATRVVRTGDELEVDGGLGVVKIIGSWEE